MPKNWEDHIADSILPNDRSESTDNVWWTLYVICMVCYFLVSLFVCFYRTDLFNMSLSSVIIYYYAMMFLKMGFRQKHLRLILYWGILAFIYDVAWLILIWKPWKTGDHSSDGNILQGTRGFVKTLSILSLVGRVSQSINRLAFHVVHSLGTFMSIH